MLVGYLVAIAVAPTGPPECASETFCDENVAGHLWFLGATVVLPAGLVAVIFGSVLVALAERRNAVVRLGGWALGTAAFWLCGIIGGLLATAAMYVYAYMR